MEMKLVDGTSQRLFLGPGLMVADYRAPPTTADMGVLRTAIAIEPDLKDGYHLIINVVGRHSGQLDAVVRNELNALMRTAPMKSAAYVLNIQGFGGVAIRTVFAGFTLLGARRPEKVFAHLDEAFVWTATLGVPHELLDDVRRALARVV